MGVWLESLRTAWATLRENRLRTALTVLTMMLGAATMTLLVSLATSALATILAGVDAVGGRELVFVSSKTPARGSKQPPKPVTPEDAAALRARIPNLRAAHYIMSMRNQPMLGDGRQVDVDVGIGAVYARFLMQRVRVGRLVEDDEAGRIIVLTTPIAKELFVDPDRALGKRVVLWNQKFEVVGVTEESATLGFGIGGISRARAVIIPERTAFQTEGIEPTGSIVLRDDGTVHDHDLQIELAQAILRFRHHEAEIECFDMRALLHKFDIVFAGIRVLVGLIALVCTLLAGTGIMNVMLASVRQRVREIGVRRALGASERDIRRQFLIESMLMSAAGGVLGAMSGIGVALALDWAVHTATPAWKSAPSFGAAAAAVVCAVLAGVMFVLRPAGRASTLVVVECLRGTS